MQKFKCPNCAGDELLVVERNVTVVSRVDINRKMLTIGDMAEFCDGTAADMRCAKCGWSVEVSSMQDAYEKLQQIGAIQ